MTKLIENFNNYSISKSGIVTNVKTNTVKKAWIGKNGYKYLDLYQNGKAIKIALHRLLATHFLPNPENKRTVNHINGNKLNNDLNNLELATDAENIQHAYDNGLSSQGKLISDSDYEKILKVFFTGVSLTEILKNYPFSLTTFSTYIQDYLVRNNLTDKFEKEKKIQKGLRAKKKGISQRIPITLQMIDKNSKEILKVFSSVTEARMYLKKKSSGPISNVIAGRQKSAYGYYWRKL